MPENKKFFRQAEEHPQCHILTHDVNLGKGKALKDAFAYVLKELPDIKGVITIDGDGQHLLPDIIACGEKMLELKDKVVLGCRDFNKPGHSSQKRGRGTRPPPGSSVFAMALSCQIPRRG